MKKRDVLGLMALGLALPTLAQTEAGYPSRPIRFIVPIAPGSSGDTLTRAVADQMRAGSGAATFVENRPGADMVVGAQNLIASPADGYSVMLVSSSTLIINPLMIKDLPYKVDDLMPLANFVSIPAVLVAAPGNRFKTMGDLLEVARRQPGSVSIGVYGNSYRLGALDLARRAGVQFNLIPYKGAAQALSDVIGGSVDAILTDVGGAAAQVAGGKVRALALAADKRQGQLPGVPTVAESGVPGYTLTIFIGYAVHARTPAPIVAVLEAMLLKAMAQPELRELVLKQTGAEVAGTPRQEFTAMVAGEKLRLQEVVKLAGPQALPR